MTLRPMDVTPEVIDALRTLRLHRENDVDLEHAVDVLSNAGIFTAIDEAADPDRSGAVTEEYATPADMINDYHN